MDNALGLSGRAGCVKDKQRVIGIHRFGFALFGCIFHFIVIPCIPAVFHITGLVIDFDDYYIFNCRCFFQCDVGDVLELDVLAGTQRNIGGNKHFAVGVVDAALEGF